MIKRLFRYLELERFGWLEIVLALFPVMAAYKYGSLYVSHVILLFLDLILILRAGKHLLKFTPLLTFLIYYVLHQIIGGSLFGLTQSYYINSTISCLIFVISLFIIVPYIDFEKFEGSINWISLFCLMGLLYHVVLIASGNSVSPIRLPFLPAPEESQSRIFELVGRPTSFFVEPQSYVSYMLFTLFFAIREAKYVWATITGISIILSTSTTGLAMIPLMIAFNIFEGRSKWYGKILLGVLLVGLAYFLFNSTWAEFGLEKLQNTELSTNSRTINGPTLFKMMEPGDYFIGVPYANATEFYNHSASLKKWDVVVDASGGVFVSGFWQCFVFFGIIGLLVYMSIYWLLWKKSQELRPLLICVIVALFSNPDYVGAMWAFQMMYLLTFARNNKINVLRS